jgi:hypothetical protein
MFARRFAGVSLFIACAVARPAGAAETPAVVVVVDGDVRLRRADGAEALRVGQAIPPAGGAVERSALRGETIAFQVVVYAVGAPVGAVALALSDLAGPEGGRLRAAVFRQHYLRVDGRSRNARTPDESLGWRPRAKPRDQDVLGEVPDALVPAKVDVAPVAPAPAVPAGALGAFWVDVDVPDGAPPGRYRGTATLDGDGAALARFAIDVDVRPTPLPYRAASVFAFYEPKRLTTRVGGGAVETQLWQLLHAHHVDALAPLTALPDVGRISSVYDGTLFSEAAGYVGPGTGRPPAVVALGAYGALGAPTPVALAAVGAMVGRLPPGPELFLYAVDEQCASSLAGDWKKALAANPQWRPVPVGQTCSDPPERQTADVAMLPAGSFPRRAPVAARAARRRAFIYNGMLPHTGTLLLDADPRGLIANGWIAAAMDISRWFYWETTFWDDGNRGGRGPIDPFVTAETFHNADGDTAMGDGLLLYPGRQQGTFAASSLGAEAVFPSIRLKAIRRGIQDAGLIALAAREQPEETARLVAQAVPAALDEAPRGARPSWEAAPLSFEAGRAALRRLVTRDAPMADGEVRAAFVDLAERRRRTVPLAPDGGGRSPAVLPVAVALGAALVVGVAARARYRRRRRGA